MWDGNRQLQEQTDTHTFTTIYEQDSFEPVARLVWLQDGIEIAANEPEYRSVWDDKPKPQSDIQIYHCHNDHLGTPNELTTHEGEVVWLADYEAWGNTAKVVWREEKLGQIKVSAEELQPIRFQGQSFDVETGLHYNRFRYFEPDLGMFISRDPIGLLGGMNTFQYAPNPTGWIDPFGLISETAPGHNVYGLYDVVASDISTRQPVLTDKPYYIGITDNLDRRTVDHINSGRLTGDGMTRLEPIQENVTHGKARGYEQALMEHYETKTGVIGEDISQSNRGNKINSFDINNKTRLRPRHNYFVNAYNQMRNKLKGCT